MNDLPLHDIHLPQSVNWWPPAIGWWLVLVLLILAGLAIFKFIRFKQAQQKKRIYRKLALRELQGIRKQYGQDKASIELLRAISTLLRRIALSYRPRESVASLTGKQWIDTLNSLSGEGGFPPEFAQLLQTAPYRPEAEFNAKELLNCCEQWIRQLPEKNDPNHTQVTRAQQEVGA